MGFARGRGLRSLTEESVVRKALVLVGRVASSAESRCDLPQLFEECKKAFSFCVPLDVLQSAKTQEEADFYIELSDFFLRQKQRELVKRGAF